MTTLPIARRPEEVATRTFDWGTIKWLVTPHLDEGADLTTGEVIVYPGKGHAPHVHPHEQEVIYVVSGEGVQTVGEDGEPFPIREGDAVSIPAEPATVPPRSRRGPRSAWPGVVRGPARSCRSR